MHRLLIKDAQLKISDIKKYNWLDELIFLHANGNIIQVKSFDSWGIGYFPAQIINSNREKYGQNLLGLCLMEVRELIK